MDSDLPKLETMQPGHEPEKPKRRPRKRQNAWAAGELVFGGVCGILSSNCFSTDHKVWGVIFSFFAVIAVLASACTVLSKLWRARWVWYAYVIAFLGILVWFWNWAIAVATERGPLPNPVLVITKTGLPTSGLHLTNAAFFMQIIPDQKVVTPANLPMCITVPVQSNEAPVTLGFTVFNDSEVELNGLSVFVSYSTNVNCSAQAPWHFAGTSIPHTRSLGLSESTLKLYGNQFRQFPRITFTPVGGWTNSGQPRVFISVDTTGLRHCIAFNLICPVFLEPVPAEVLEPQVFQLPADQLFR